MRKILNTAQAHRALFFVCDMLQTIRKNTCRWISVAFLLLWTMLFIQVNFQMFTEDAGNPPPEYTGKLHKPHDGATFFEMLKPLQSSSPQMYLTPVLFEKC